MDMAARRWLGLLNFALLLLVAELRPLGAQTTNLFAGTFDELFSNGGKLTPTSHVLMHQRSQRA
jgi:hypothetical protein